jgi:hypothetical protein
MRPTTSTAPTVSRWGPAAGVGFAALTLYALLGPPKPPDPDASAAAWQAHLADAGNRGLLLASAVAATIAGVLFVMFMAGLRQRGLLAPSSALTTVGFGCGLLFVMNNFATWAAWVTVPAGIQISGEPMPDGDLIRFFNDLGQAFLAIPTPLCAGAFAVVITREAIRTGGMPRWLARTGTAVGLAQLAGILYFPFLSFPIWVGVAGIVLLRTPSPSDIDRHPTDGPQVLTPVRQ